MDWTLLLGELYYPQQAKTYFLDGKDTERLFLHLANRNLVEGLLWQITISPPLNNK